MSKKFGAIKCWSCERVIALTPANTVSHVFTRQPWLNFLMVLDANCGACTRYFAEIDDQAAAAKAGCAVMLEEFADDSVWQGYCEARGIEAPQHVDLPPTLSRECDNFSEVVAHVPDDLLWDALTEPMPPRMLPERWT